MDDIKFIPSGEGKLLIEPMEFDNNDKIGSKFINNPSMNNQNASGSKLIRPMQFEAKQKSPEEKIYIILYAVNTAESDDPCSKIYSVCIGRTMAYIDIKTKLIEGMDIDVHRSYVMTETRQTETETGDIKYYMIPYEECISVYSFCVSVGSFYTDDDFDIEDYSDGDIPENRLPNTSDAKSLLSSDQLQYRSMLEESLQRDKFINDMRNTINNSHNV